MTFILFQVKVNLFNNKVILFILIKFLKFFGDLLCFLTFILFQVKVNLFNHLII